MALPVAKIIRDFIVITRLDYNIEVAKSKYLLRTSVSIDASMN